MSTKGQFKMYLEPEMIDRLNELALRFSRGSKQSIVEEIVSVFLPTWIAVNTSIVRAIEVQVQNQVGESERRANTKLDAVKGKREAAVPVAVKHRKLKSENDSSERHKGEVARPRKRRSS